MRFYIQVLPIALIAVSGVIAITTDENGLNHRSSEFTSQSQRAQSRRISSGSTTNGSPRAPFQAHNPFYDRNNGRHQTRMPTRHHRPHNHPAPPYAVQMEPLVQYSQRDPLYHQKQDGNNITSNDNVIEETKSQSSRIDSEPESTNNAEISDYGTPGVLDSQIQYDANLYPQYYKEPEPIIEIIIKESNESLPALPPPPTQHIRPTKEPVQVFYVKYKKNPAGNSKNGEEVVYDPPIPALTPATADIDSENPVPHEVTYQPPVTLPPPPSTTLRTIIHPDSEIYHGTGLRVTFGEPETKTSDSNVEEQSAPEPSIALPTPQFGAQNRAVSVNLPLQSQFKRQQGPYHPLPQHIPGSLNQALNPPPPPPTSVVSLQPGTYQTPPPLPPPPPPPQIQFPHQTQQFNQAQHKVVFPHQSSQQPLPFRPQHTNTLFSSQQHVQQHHPQTLVQVQPSQQPIHLPSNQQLNQRPPIQQSNQQIQLRQQQTRQHNNPYASLHSQAQRTNFRVPQNTNLNHQDVDQQRVLINQQEQIRLQQQQSHQKQQQQQQQQQNQQILQSQHHQLQSQHTNHHQIPPTQIYQRQPFNQKSENKQVNQNLQQFPSQPIHVQPQPEFNSNQFRIQLPNIQQPDIKVTKPLPLPSKPIHPFFASHYQQQLQNQQKNIVPYNHEQQQKHLQTEINIQPSTGVLLSSSQVPSTLQPQLLPNQQIQLQNQQIYHQQQNQNQLNKQIPVSIGPIPIGGSEIIQSIPAAEGHQLQNQFSKKTPLIFEVNKQLFSAGQSALQPTKSNIHQPLAPNSQYTYLSKQSVYTTIKPPGSTVFPPTNQSPVYTAASTSPVYRPEYLHSTSTTTEKTGEDTVDSVKNVKEKNKQADIKKKENLAALPDEVPDDLREQLLSSGILSNADIQILDYDKVGDIPIESLPPEALENFYGAGSAPIPVVVPPNKTPKAPVEMKVVRYNPSTKEGQKIEDSYIKQNATQLDSVVLNDSKYNRYLPLKVSGANFPLPDVPQLHDRIINSVVVLAPVDYDFVKEAKEEDHRSGRAAAIQVQGVRFIAGESLKKLIKDPTTENYKSWLAKEKNTPISQQSVVLLVTSPSEAEAVSSKEIFMYDVASEKVTKLRGELSSTFVEVAESNANSQEIDGLSSVPILQDREDDTFGLSSEQKEIKVTAPVYTDANEKLAGFSNRDEDLAMAASELELEHMENNSVLPNEAPLISSGYSKTMAYSSSQ